MSEEPVLRPEEVAGVLSGDAGNAPQPHADGEAQPYSLREPVAIPAAAEAQARGRLEGVVAALAELLDAEAEGGIKVLLEGFQQQRAAAALSVLPGPVWVTALAAKRGGGIALALQPAVALALMDRALGGPGDPPEDGREPTSLEGRVVSRMFGAIAEKLGAIFETDLTPVELTTDRIPDRVAASGETVGVSPLRFTIGETDHASLLLASASLLVPSGDRATPKARPVGPLARSLENVVMPVVPVIPAGRVSLTELSSLESGKVLKFDVVEDSMVELRVGETVIAGGRIRRQTGQTVFKIESRVGDKSTEEPS